MPIPLGPIAARAARKVYRDARGRFTTRIKYELSERRLPSGRFGTLTQARFFEGYGTWMRAEVGPPSGRLSWKQLASRYPEKFEDWTEHYSLEIR
jgi:hypothetical protein